MNQNATSERAGAILNAAERLIRAEGADGWSLAALADLAGMAEDDVRSTFSSEWEVFCGVIRRDETRFELAIQELAAGSPSERVTALLEASVPNFDWTYWIELWSMALRDERARELRAELDERFRAVIERMVVAGAESGDFDVSDTRAAAVTIATLMDAMACQATLGDTTIRPNYMLDACVTVAGSILGAPLSVSRLEEGRRD